MWEVVAVCVRVCVCGENAKYNVPVQLKVVHVYNDMCDTYKHNCTTLTGEFS